MARSVIPEMRSELRQVIEQEIDTAGAEKLVTASFDRKANEVSPTQAAGNLTISE